MTENAQDKSPQSGSADTPDPAHGVDDSVGPQSIPGEFPLPAPPSEEQGHSENWFRDETGHSAHNVTRPTLAPFLPDPEKATGAGVLVIPGGGFMMLAMSNEGWDVAQWLADHGVAAFVLKYRLLPTPSTGAGVMQQFMQALEAEPEFSTTDWFLAGTRTATEDATKALTAIRANAEQYGVDPEKLGVMGFSAGAFTTMNIAYESDEASMPAFLATVYGPTTTPTRTVPENPPALWTAFAADDPLVGSTDFGLFNAWREKGGTVEFHLHEAGSHGYGFAGTQGTTTTAWPRIYLEWLRSHGLAD